MQNTDEAIYGSLLGTAVGDALGLPAEGLSRKRQLRMYRHIDRHRLFFGRGMVSDDTEHTCMVAQSLIVSAGDPDDFTYHLAGEMRRWLLLLPAGVGLSTLRAILRLLFGVRPERSGVYSAGNGAAMRSAIIGVCYYRREERQQLSTLVRASTRITHTDPRAEAGAMAIALAAAFSRAGDLNGEAYRAALNDLVLEPELQILVKKVVESTARGESTTDFATAQGWGARVTGYVYQGVPVALHASLSHPTDYRAAIESVISCGGDTDTTAAMVGGIVGANVGVDGVPEPWRSGLFESPRSVKWIKELAVQLTAVIDQGQAQRPLALSPVLLALRNLFFVFVVLAHGFRRLLPPY